MRKLLLLAIAVVVSAMAASAAQANQPGSVELKGEVAGNVSITGGDTQQVFESIIGGNLRVSGGSGYVNVSGAQVGGNLEYNDNTAPYQYLYLNTVARNLSCEGNDPVPIQFMEGNGERWFENIVGGNASGQCAVGP